MELSVDELDAVTAFNVAELLLSGCTTHIEQSLSLRQAESYVRVARAFGARGYPGGMIPGILRLFPIWFRGTNDQVLFDSEAGTLAEIEANLEFGRRNNGIENGRIRPMMAPHATDTQTPATMAAITSGLRVLLLSTPPGTRPTQPALGCRLDGRWMGVSYRVGSMWRMRTTSSLRATRSAIWEGVGSSWPTLRRV